MSGYPLFNAFSDFAIAGPRKIKPIQQLPKLMVVHNVNLNRPLWLFKKNDNKLAGFLA